MMIENTRKNEPIVIKQDKNRGRRGNSGGIYNV